MTNQNKPVLLDLFCCAGGAARGYQQAGFYVIGVDRVPRPNYCGDEFIQMDAAQYMDPIWQGQNFSRLGEKPTLIHWSPPCQANSVLVQGTHKTNRKAANRHVDMIPIMRPLIEATGLPNVLEQPAGKAEMRKDLMLCMDMHEMQRPPLPPWVQRHRYFELNGFTVSQPKHIPHQGRVRGWRHGVCYDGPYVQAYGHGGGKAEVPDMQHAMGIDWTDVREELTEAIPPAYTRYVGAAFLFER